MKENRKGAHYRAPGIIDQEASSRRLTGSRLHSKIYTDSESSNFDDSVNVPSIPEKVDRPELNNLRTRSCKH